MVIQRLGAPPAAAADRTLTVWGSRLLTCLSGASIPVLKGCGTAAPSRTTAPPPPKERWSSGSCTCDRATTSVRLASRCTSSATTTSRSPPLACGGSWTGWGSAGCRRTSATNAAPSARSATRNNGQVHRVQIDVKFIAPIDGVTTKRHYQFTAIDDCTRLRVLRIYPKADQRTAIAFLDYVAERLPFPIEVIQTDNGAEFQTGFGWHVLDRGIGHACIKPATPRLNGKVERSHRIDAEKFYRLLEGVTIDDTELFNDRLREWEDYYNFERPHGGLDGQTPYERLKQKTSQPWCQPPTSAALLAAIATYARLNGLH